MDIADEAGRTPLYHAAGWSTERGFAGVQCLLQLGARVNVRDRKGQTPLHHAAAYRTVEVVAALLEAGAEADIPDDEGKTARDVASGPDQERIRALRLPLRAIAREGWGGVDIMRKRTSAAKEAFPEGGKVTCAWCGHVHQLSSEALWNAPLTMPCEACGFLFLEHMDHRMTAMQKLLDADPQLAASLREGNFEELKKRVDALVPPPAWIGKQ